MPSSVLGTRKIKFWGEKSLPLRSSQQTGAIGDNAQLFYDRSVLRLLLEGGKEVNSLSAGTEETSESLTQSF